ncbi:hypothetical protein FRB97_001376 [Tulasnella sp. 331]|nr:hypothetical protein FRB97_001376 [Tulasnella sp. 331]
MVAVFGLLEVVMAAQVVTVNATDPSIMYMTSTTGNTANASWAMDSSMSCSQTQMITYRVGDYTMYTFNGTAISVLGTIGTKRGLIQFSIDGSQNVTIDRTNTVLQCDTRLFTTSGLNASIEHTLTATLVGLEPNATTGVLEGCLSVQSIQVTLPDNTTSITPIADSSSHALSGGAVAGVVIGVLLALLMLLPLGWFLFKRWRRRRNPTPDNENPLAAGGNHSSGPTDPGMAEVARLPSLGFSLQPNSVTDRMGTNHTIGAGFRRPSGSPTHPSNVPRSPLPPSSPPTRNEKLFPYSMPLTTANDPNDTSQNAYEYHQDDLPTNLRATQHWMPRSQSVPSRSGGLSSSQFQSEPALMRSPPPPTNSRELLLEEDEFPQDPDGMQGTGDGHESGYQGSPRMDLSDESVQIETVDDITMRIESMMNMAAAAQRRLNSEPPSSPLALRPDSRLTLSLPTFSPLNVPQYPNISSASTSPTPTPAKKQRPSKMPASPASTRSGSPYTIAGGEDRLIIAATSTPLLSRLRSGGRSRQSTSSAPTSPPPAPSALFRASLPPDARRGSNLRPSPASNRSFFGNNVI